MINILFFINSCNGMAGKMNSSNSLNNMTERNIRWVDDEGLNLNEESKEFLLKNNISEKSFASVKEVVEDKNSFVKILKLIKEKKSSLDIIGYILEKGLSISYISFLIDGNINFENVKFLLSENIKHIEGNNHLSIYSDENIKNIKLLINGGASNIYLSKLVKDGIIIENIENHINIFEDAPKKVESLSNDLTILENQIVKSENINLKKQSANEIESTFAFANSLDVLPKSLDIVSGDMSNLQKYSALIGLLKNKQIDSALKSSKIIICNNQIDWSKISQKNKARLFNYIGNEEVYLIKELNMDNDGNINALLNVVDNKELDSNLQKEIVEELNNKIKW